MNTLQTITLFLLLTTSGCNNTPHDSVPKPEAPKFVLDSSELKLLADDEYGKRVSTDSLMSISQYDSIKRSFFEKKTNWENSFCLGFTFLGNANFKSKKIWVQLIPLSYRIVATTIPMHSILVVSITSSNSIYSIVGNEFYHGEELPPGSLNSYVKRLFLNEPDTSRYGQKIVRLVFPNDNFQFTDEYLTQLVTGYIDAQRELCRERFQKDLKNASIQEIQELKKTTPFRFKIIRNKNYN